MLVVARVDPTKSKFPLVQHAMHYVESDVRDEAHHDELDEERRNAERLLPRRFDRVVALRQHHVAHDRRDDAAAEQMQREVAAHPLEEERERCRLSGATL